MKNSRFVYSLSFIAIMFCSVLSFVPANENPTARNVVKKANDTTLDVDLSKTYAQIGSHEGVDKLRFVTAIDMSNENVEKVNYTRIADFATTTTVEKEVTSLYKSVAGSEDTVYYYDGTELVNSNPENGYYFASYVVAYKSSANKANLFTVAMDVNDDAAKAPFLTTSYNAIAASEANAVASFIVDGELVGRCIVEQGNAPVYYLETEEGQYWSDGVNYFEELPTITTDTEFTLVSFADVQASAKATLNDITSDLSLYTPVYQTAIKNLVEEAIADVTNAKTANEISDVLTQTKSDIENISSVVNESATAFVNSMEKVGSSQPYVVNEDGTITHDSTWAEWNIGNQSGNGFVVFDTYMTINYAGGYPTLKFRKWSNASTYTVVIKSSEVTFNKIVDSTTTKIASVSGIADGERIHIQAMAYGWKKVILINETKVLEVDENAYTVGYTSIENWNAAVTLDNMFYHEFASAEEFDATKYSRLLNITSTRNLAIAEINNTITNGDYTEDQKEILFDEVEKYFVQINNAKVDEIETIKEYVLANMESILAEVLNEKITAHSAIINSLATNTNPENVTVDQTNGKIVVSGLSGANEIAFLDRNHSHYAMRFEINPTYANTTYSYMQIRFGMWSKNSTYNMVVYNNSISIRKHTSQTEYTEIASYDYGFANNETASVVIMCSGWAKKVVVNGTVVANISENSYNVGWISIESWQTSYTLDNVVAKTYDSNSALVAEFPEYNY